VSTARIYYAPKRQMAVRNLSSTLLRPRNLLNFKSASMHHRWKPCQSNKLCFSLLCRAFLLAIFSPPFPAAINCESGFARGTGNWVLGSLAFLRCNPVRLVYALHTPVFTWRILVNPAGSCLLPCLLSCPLAYWLLMFMATRCRRLICASYSANEIYNFIWRPLQ